MDVLLIQPPIEDYYTTGIRSYPLGLTYLASSIKDLANVRILDFRISKKPVRLNHSPFPDLDEYFNPHLKGAFSLFRHYSRFGLQDYEIENTLKNVQADVVGISMLFSAYYAEARDVVTLVRKCLPDAVIIAGGLHATLFPEQVLDDSAVDYVIRGEGETPFRMLIKAIKKGNLDCTGDIPGVCSKRGGSITFSDPVIEDSLDGQPDFSSLSLGNYSYYGRQIRFVQTTRGCPMDCHFCGKPSGSYREKALDTVLEEIHLHRDSGAEVIDFEDDMLLFNKKRIKTLFSQLVDIPVACYAMNGLYPHFLDAELISNMELAGFEGLNISLVDISSNVLTKQGRGIPEAYISLIDRLELSPMKIEVHFIIGLPKQTIADVLDTIGFLLGRNVLLGPSVYYPVPGSAYWSSQIDFKYCRSSCMFPANFSQKTTFTLMRIVRFVNFCKQMADQVNEQVSISDILADPHLWRSDITRTIFSSVIEDNRFMSWSKREQKYVIESQDRDLVKMFIKKLRGKIMCGYKSGGRLIFDQ